MNDRQRSLNGIIVNGFRSWDELLDYVDRDRRIYVAINAEKIIAAPDEVREMINRNVGYCDGIGAVKALKRKGLKDIVRLPGCELWLKIIERYHRDWKFYIIGASPEVHEATVRKLREQYPGINIVGHRDGYIKDDAAREALIADVAEKRPDAVFVAMGSPKQERLMGEMQQRHQAVYVGLGGSYDVYTGAVKRTPRMWQKLNLEFMYRLVRQPSRWRRQLNYIPFLYRLYTGKL